MKLNYSSLQHAVHPLEERAGGATEQVLGELPLRRPVAVISLHGQLPCVAWAAADPGAIHAALTELGWDACIAGPGPGILGSATALGHGGLAGLDTAHAALALGCPTILVPRMSSGDARPRHQGLSHHTATVLELLLRPALVAVPAGALVNLPGEHEARAAEVDLDGYAASQLPARTMGRSMEEDELFFRAALAGGGVLAEVAAATQPAAP
jgi:hypothetical protein